MLRTRAVNSSGVAVDVRAKDLASLAQALPIGTPPACAKGNDASIDLALEPYSFAAVMAYDGAVFYEGRSGAAPHCLMFDVPGLVSAGNPSPQISVCVPEAIFPEPTPGQEFWVSRRAATIALRGAQQGPLLLAKGYGSLPLSNTDVAALAQTLGVAVSAEQRCDYAPPGRYASTDTWLWDVVFGTTPAVRVSTKSLATVNIDGRNHRVWSSAEGDHLAFEIY